MTAAEWLQDENTFTTCVLALLMDKYEAEFLTWDPITINLQITEDFGVQPTDILLDKINAGSCLFTSNLFQISLPVFLNVCNVLNLGVATSEMFLPADLDDVYWGITESKLLLGDEDEETPFSHDVGRYVGLLLAQEGLYEIPPLLSFAEIDEEQMGNLADNLTEQDPVMAKAFWTRQQDEKDQFEEVNQQKLNQLLLQLSDLPIKQLNKAWVDKNLAKLDLRQRAVAP